VRPLDRVLRTLAVTGLAGAPEPAADEMADAVDGDELVTAAISARLTGPLLDAVDRGRLVLAPAAEQRLEEAQRGALLWCLHLERRLLRVLDLLDTVEVRPVVVKGTAVAHLDRPTPELRTFADLDLLVPGPAMDRTVAVLLAEGGRRPWAERRAGYDRRFAKSVTVTDPDGVELDLHRTLCDGVHGFRIPVEELTVAPATFDLGGRQVDTLRREHRTLHAAYHLVLGSPRPALHNLADLAFHLAAPGAADVVASTVATARRWRGEAVLATAFDEAVDALDFEVAPAWRAWRATVVLDPAEVSIIDAQRRDGSSFGLSRAFAVGELGDRREQAAFLATVLWPTRAHLDSRGVRRRDPLVEVVDRLRGRRSG
jgi:hypothetical protein